MRGPWEDEVRGFGFRIVKPHGILDSADYAEYMSRGDSGAIIVGAGTADTFHDKVGTVEIRTRRIQIRFVERAPPRPSSPPPA